MKLTHAIPFLILIFPTTIFAEQTGNQIQNLQEQERRNIIQRKEFEEIGRVKKSLPSTQTQIKSKEVLKNNWCFAAKNVELQGSEVFSVEDLSRKFLEDLPQCLSRADLDKIKSDIENFYIKKGYSNARVYFDNEALKKNILLIKIYEGVVGAIELSDNSKVDRYLAFRNQTKLFTAFPFLQNKVFNLRDFEQGMDQINRLQSSKAKMDVRPSDKDGESVIIIDNEVGNLTNLTAGYDNSGQKSTGKNKAKFSASQDNLLGLNDNLYINYSQDTAAKDDEKYSKSFYSALSIPLGYWTFQTDYSQSKYLITSYLQNSTTKYSGVTNQTDYSAERVMMRGARYKLNFKTSLALKDTNSYSNNMKSSVGSRKLSMFINNLNYTYYHKYDDEVINSFTNISLSHTKGTNWFDAKKDDPNIPKNESHAQFEKLFLTLNHSIPFWGSYIYVISVDGQYAMDSLYSTEQFSVGGQYTVRGFNENSISGDNGYNIKNSVEKRLVSDNTYINKLLLSIFYDYGYVRNKYITDITKEGYVDGVGAKLRYPDGEYFKWDLAYARGLHSPQFIQGVLRQKKDNGAIYFNVSLAFGV